MNSNSDKSVLNRIQTYLGMALFLPIQLVIMLVILFMPFVVYTLTSDNLNFYIELLSYALAAYSLFVFCICVPRIYRKIKKIVIDAKIFIISLVRKLLFRFDFTRRFIKDIEFRALVVLHCSLAINALYVVFNGYSGVKHNSIWFIAVAVYYFTFGIIRYLLVRRYWISNTIINKIEAEYYEIRTYRLCGILMFTLNAIMSGMIIQMLLYGYAVGELLPYEAILSAVYTFYITALSINNLVKFRKSKNVILSAAKKLSFVGALMSMFTLQTSLLNVFGTSEANVKLINTLTGGSVTLINLGLAFYMMVTSSKKLTELNYAVKK